MVNVHRGRVGELGAGRGRDELQRDRLASLGCRGRPGSVTGNVLTVSPGPKVSVPPVIVKSFPRVAVPEVRA